MNPADCGSGVTRTVAVAPTRGTCSASNRVTPALPAQPAAKVW